MAAEGESADEDSADKDVTDKAEKKVGTDEEADVEMW